MPNAILKSPFEIDCITLPYLIKIFHPPLSPPPVPVHQRWDPRKNPENRSTPGQSPPAVRWTLDMDATEK